MDDPKPDPIGPPVADGRPPEPPLVLTAPILADSDAEGPDEPPLGIKPARIKRYHRPHRFGTYWLVPAVLFLSLALLFAGLALSEKNIRIPVWAVVEAEQRVNRTLQEITGDATSLSIGSAVFVVDKDWVPRLRLEDIRLIEANGATLLSLPELRVAIDPGSLVTGKIRLRSLRLIGANINLRRLEDGQFDIALNLNMKPRPIVGLSDVLYTLVTLSNHSALSSLRVIEAQALTLTIDDRKLGRVWELGDGRLQMTNRPDQLAAELGVSVSGGVSDSGTAVVTLIAAKPDASASISVSVDRVAAADIAVQAAPLAWLGVLDAPISGQFTTTLAQNGGLAAIEASLTLGAGALQPTPQTEPVPFEAASLFFGYDPGRERLDLREATVTSKEISLKASGHAYMPGVSSRMPTEILSQIQIDNLQIDPPGALEGPVLFEQGALDYRVRLQPFGIDIGQATLTHQGQHLVASGRVDAGPDGWTVGVNAQLDQIDRDRLMAIWPSMIVPKTRLWVSENVQSGSLSNVRAGFRLAPKADPLFSLGYDFTGADVRYLKSLPPIEGGRGYSVVQGKSYTMVLEQGHVTAKTGGQIDAAGTVFSVQDVTQKPAQAKIALKAKGGMTAALSILDEAPFNFMTKANLPVDLGQGQADVTATIHTPLRKGVKIQDVDFDVKGIVTGVSSDRLVPGRVMRADRLNLRVTPKGMEIGGKGFLQDVPFDGSFTKQFGPEYIGLSQVKGSAELSPKAAANLGINLPDGLLGGKGKAQVTVDLNQGTSPRLALRSDLSGVSMEIPSLGWSKPALGTGQLAVDVTLGKPAAVDAITLDAAGLKASGAISLNPDGSMNEARFSSVKLGTWMDVAATLTGRGKDQTPAIAVTGGRVDLRGLPSGGPGAAGSTTSGPTISLALDQLTVAQGLDLTAFRSNITPNAGGVLGEFSGRVNGQKSVAGILAPTPSGTAVRLQSDDAGAVFSAAKIFPNAQGGAMDLILNPTGTKGSYDGKLTMGDIRIRKTPTVAGLINAISVVGLLDQLNGSGILFNTVEASFQLGPQAVAITQGSAVGNSLGVSLTGLYVFNGARLDLRGVVSPVYFLNAIGSLFTNNNEGLFGFNYSITGTAKEPSVSVNPLSILTPGTFRDIFRSDPPKLEPSE